MRNERGRPVLEHSGGRNTTQKRSGNQEEFTRIVDRKSPVYKGSRRVFARIVFFVVLASLIGAAALVFAGFLAGILALSHTDGWDRAIAGAAIVAATYLFVMWCLVRSGR